jgi:hypothetical protein
MGGELRKWRQASHTMSSGANQAFSLEMGGKGSTGY